jgi:hypothetical protein
MLSQLYTLDVYDELKVQFTEAQAHVLSKALKQVERVRIEELATKSDLHLLKTDQDARSDKRYFELDAKTDKVFDALDAKIDRLELRLTVKFGAMMAIFIVIVVTLVKLL